MNTSRYYKNYFKHNGVVLICELLIVLLLSLICSILIDGSPRWLAPTLAVVAYLLAELRFLMAYIAKCVKRERLAREQQLAAEEHEDAEVAGGDLPTAEEENEELLPADDEDDVDLFIPEQDEEDEEDALPAFADDEEDVLPFELGEEDEVSEATPEDDEDIDTFADDEDTRK